MRSHRNHSQRFARLPQNTLSSIAPENAMTTTKPLTTAQISAGYDAIADQIWESPSLYRDALRLAPDCSGDILDIGCGQGRFLEVISRSCSGVKSISGCDISPKLIELSKARLPNGKFEVANALTLENYATASFDYVFMIASLEHMIDHEAAVRSAYRVLKPNGVICIAVPNRRWVSYKKWLRNRTEFQPVDDYWFEPEELLSLMRNTGLKPERIRGLWALFRGNWIHQIENGLASIFPILHQRMKLIGVRARK